MRGNVIDKDGHDARQKPAEKETEQRFANQKTAKSDADALLHELQVHQIELEMQNDELRAVEQQLQKSQQEYADLFESAPVGYLILDTKARIIKINRMGLDILKQPIEKINGRPLSMYIDTADLAVFMAHKKVVLDNGLRQGCELRLVKADNTTISAYLISEPVKDKAGKIIQCRTSITDLTQTKDEQRYHAIADYTYDWESWVDPDGRLLWVNPAVERLTGYTIKEYQNLPDRLKQVLFEEDLEMCRAHYERGFRQRLSGNDIEFRIRHKNGSLRWAAMSYQPIYANNGDFLGMRSSIRDINDRKQAEEAARTNKERFRQVFDNISSGMAVYEAVDNGEDFIIREFNPAAERITNLQRSKVLGCRVSQVFPTVTIFGLFKVFQRVWHNGIPECHPANMYHDDRLEFWAENYVFKLPTGEVVAIFDDITDRKQAEEAMRESKAELERINNDLVQTAIQIKTLMNDVVAKNDFTGKFFSQSLPPCWEVKKCGNTACPSYRNHANLRCWEVAGTFCCGKVQGKVAQKLGDCQLCEVYQNARANPIMDLGETFNDMITVLKDRYEEIQKINENLEIANQQLTEHDRLKNEFVDTVTHELRT
ncbi:MAG: PAS domain S-box protein, partial [Sedimentisphaerales bacterium]|nr:PAS domain S-box protein [Sedimentisphaerales bacterium]